MRRTTRESGFSLIEASFGISLLSLLITGVLSGMSGIAQNYAQGYRLQRMDDRARHAIKEIREFLSAAGRDTLAPAPVSPLGADTLDFRQVQGFAAGAPVFSADQRITIELDPREFDNGQDDDGDGLIDERQIVFLRDVGLETQKRTIIARNVAAYLEGELPNGADDNGNGLIDERGLSLELVDGNKLEVRLTIEGRSAARRTLRRTSTAVIHLRN